MVFRMKYKGLVLDKFQQEAISLIDSNTSVIVSAPTGAGKTVIAEYAIEKSLEKDKSVIYTAPIKALSNQKFRDFKLRYPNQVGIMTGDLSLNTSAPILIMTTEIFRNALLEDPQRYNNVNYLIFDEVHYLQDEDRGTVWEESIIFAPEHIQILALSATIPNVDEFVDWIQAVRQKPTKVVRETKRPVPLREYCHLFDNQVLDIKEARKKIPKKTKNYSKDFTPLSKNEAAQSILSEVLARNHIPCLYFVFSRKEAQITAVKCKNRLSLLSKEERTHAKKRIDELAEMYGIANFSSKELYSLLLKGIGYHHAGMLPALKEIIELLFTEGYLKLLFATETFALGVNMPAKSVVFSKIKKFDGTSVRPLKPLEYQQMSGRAGRRGMDEVGHVYIDLTQDPISVNELNRVVSDQLSPIQSRFNLSYSTILSLYGHLGEDILTASDKSFAVFQKARALKQHEKKKKRMLLKSQRNLLKQKLAFLQGLGYVQKDGLTSKGRFASQVCGHEVELTELFFDGFLEGANERVLFCIVVALTFEGRKGGRYNKIPKEVRKLSKRIEKRILSICKLENMYGIRDCIKMPDFRLSSAALAWSSGKSFSSIQSQFRVDAGDIIRNFRLAIQILRQLKKICVGYDSFVGLVDNCILAVNRDEVNALRQLQVFSDLTQQR